MTRMIFHERDFGTFNFRIGALIIKNDKILLCKCELDNFYFLPGGRVEFFESSKQTLQRELEEELKETCIIKNLIWLVEDLYVFRGKNFHEVSLYYKTELPENSKIHDQEKTFMAYEAQVKIFFKWFDIKSLLKINIHPDCLKEKIKNLSLFPEHIIGPGFEKFNFNK